MSKHTYEVVVGNVGTVYNGPSLVEAKDWYDSYARASASRTTRALPAKM
jgi:hypothetical protein